MIVAKKTKENFLFFGRVSYKKQKVFIYFFIILITALTFTNLIKITPKVFSDLRSSDLRLLFASSQLELRLRQRIGPEAYDYYKFVRDNTPTDARILIPPQGLPWPRIGNAAYSRYFLYPRYLVSGKENEPGVDLKKENIQYVLVSWGEVNLFQYGYTSGWPKFKVPAKKIVYMSLSDGTTREKTLIRGQDFEPSELTTGLWGLVEVDENKL